MHITKKAIFIGGGLLVAVLALMLVFSTGNSNDQAEANVPAAPGWLCLEAAAPDQNADITLTIPGSLGVAVQNDGARNLGLGDVFCEPANKAIKTDPTPTTPVDPERMRCFEVTNGGRAGVAFDVSTQFDKSRKTAEVQILQTVCLPATKANAAPPQPGATPTYACFDIKMSNNDTPARNVETPNFRLNLTILNPERLCLPASFEHKPIAPTPEPAKLPEGEPLVCFNIVVNSQSPTVSFKDVKTNLGVESLALSTPVLYCTNAKVLPKLLPTGNLSGIANITVGLTDPAVDPAFRCKVRTDHDGATNEIKTAVICFVDAPAQGDPDSKVPINPDLTDFDPLNGPPPPYGNGGPQKGRGNWNPGTDVLTSTTCFESLGGALGPNVISVVNIPNAKATLPNQAGIVDIFYVQGIDECKALVPNDPLNPTLSLPLTIDTYDTPPYDNATSVDSDGDGCPDAFELDKNRGKKDCGDDPFNPHDSDLNFTGIFTITVEVVRADTCASIPDPEHPGPPPIGCDTGQPKQVTAGSYFNCQAFLDHDKSDNSITGRAFCYTDNPVTTVNMEDNGGNVTCAPFGTGTPDMCGDGLPGAAPPDPMGDNDGDGENAAQCPNATDDDGDTVVNDGCRQVGLNAETGAQCTDAVDALEDGAPDAVNDGCPRVSNGPMITGFLDKDKNKLVLEACFRSVENPTQGPNVFAELTIDAHTGLGTTDIYLNRPNCTAGAVPNNKAVGVALGEQDDDYDVDNDGCSTRQELGKNQNDGGLRDPYNKYDHDDGNKDGFITIPDILELASHFGPIPPMDQPQQGEVGPRMLGSVPWAHRNHDNVVSIPDDILGIAGQFGHNCP